MKVFDKRFVVASVMAFALLTFILVTNQGKSYALTTLSTPEITSFGKSTVEQDALKVEFKSSNTGTDFSYEILDAVTGKVQMLAGSSTNYTYQNLESGEYKIQIRACTSSSNVYSCTSYSAVKSFTLLEEVTNEDDLVEAAEGTAEEATDELDDTEDASSLDDEMDGSDEATPPTPAPVIVAKLSTTSYVYNGKTKKPSVTVTADGKKLTANTNYTVKYPSKMINIGTYTVTVTGKGGYSFTKKPTYVINPPATTIKSKSAKKNSITVKFTSKKGGVKYQLGYKKSSAKNYSTSNSSSTSKTVKSLSKNTKYNLKVRTYKVVNNKTYYSAWSKVSSITTKKK